MTKYFAVGNINHNGRAYVRGDVVNELSEEQAEFLLKSGTLSLEPIEVATSSKVDESVPTEPESVQPDVLGSTEAIGEPHIDNAISADEAGVSAEATDVTPGMAPVAENEETIEEAGEVLTGGTPEASEGESEPVVDPSADL